MNGNGTETGQIITTVIGGHDGQPKQVISLLWFYSIFPHINLISRQ